jgi:thioredoxin-dependent peroxiredoxin
MLQENQSFPEFTLPNQDGTVLTREYLLGTKTVVYFYPKDDTSGCTVEACEFRDTLPNLQGVKVIGVSPDGIKSHRKFVDKYGLSFDLLADEGHELSEAVGVWVEKSMYGKKYMGVERTTFVLDSDGKVKKVFNKVKPQGHASQVLEALAEF